MTEMNHIQVPEGGNTVPTPDAVTVEEPGVVTEPKCFTGTVVGCRKLNVREHPTTEADALCVLRAGTEVQVYADEHYDEWYHVLTATGVDGFCMKKYIQ